MMIGSIIIHELQRVLKKAIYSPLKGFEKESAHSEP